MVRQNVPRRIYNQNRDILYQEFYLSLASEISSLLEKNQQINLALCGGRSVKKLYELFIKNTGIVWSKINIFMVDERLVSIEDNESNYKLAYDNFIKHLLSTNSISEKQLFPFRYDKNSNDYGVKIYEDCLLDKGGFFDIAILSIGEDGHIGALYPKHHSIKDLHNSFIHMDDSPKLPSKRMSASASLVSRTKVSYLLALGDGKQDAFNKLLDESKSDCIIDLPARLIYKNPKSYLITDIN